MVKSLGEGRRDGSKKWKGMVVPLCPPRDQRAKPFFPWTPHHGCGEIGERLGDVGVADSLCNT